MGGYKNERVDELIEKALAMSREDPEFCPTIREAEDVFLADAMLIPLYTNHRLSSWHAKSPWRNPGRRTSSSGLLTTFSLGSNR